MTKSIALLVLTLVPPVYVLFFFALIAYTVLASSPPAKEAFVFIFLFHLAITLLNLALVGFYLYHAFNNARLKSDQKVLWMAVLFFGNVLAMPVYWYWFFGPNSRRANETSLAQSSKDEQ